MENEDRRKADEAFRLEVVRSQAEIKTILTHTEKSISELRDNISKQAISIANVQYAIWGGPKESDIGLLEKHRRLNRNWTIAVAIVAFCFSALGKIISPLYDKFVADWAYNSVSERWEREQKRPKVRVYHIHENVSPSGEESSSPP